MVANRDHKTATIRLGHVLVLMIGLAAIPVWCKVQTEPAKDGRYYEQQARQAYAAKDYATFLANMIKAAELRPNHPRLLYNLAAAYALNDRPDEALARLRLLAEMGLVMPAARDKDFTALRESAQFNQLTVTFEKNKAETGQAAQVFSLPEKGMIAEGLAYDPKTGSYFVSSVHRRKIIRVDRNGKASEFANAQQGLWAALGMRVDAQRRLLWVTSAALPQMTDYQQADQGRSGILKFDLRTGRLLKKYALENQDTTHVLGDLALTKNGDVFASDSLNPTIYAIPHSKDQIERFISGPQLSSPQGLAFSADEKWLYLADYGSGLFAINMKTKQLRRIAPSARVTLLGIDGLYFYQGDLIGVQNGVNPQRVVRIRLSPDNSSVSDFRVLCANNPLFDEPSLGVVVNRDFVFVANSQWGKISDEGKLAPAEQLRDPIILKIKLDSK